MKYTVKFRPQALKQLEKIDEPDQGRIFKRIESLTYDPRPEGVKKLMGPDDFYRIRVGDYRVVYQIKDDILTVLMMRVAHRKDVYRK